MMADARIRNENVKNNAFILEQRGSDSEFVGKIVANNDMNTVV